MSEMPQVKCPECGRMVDGRKHNLKAHRRTHGLKGSNPVKMADLFALPAATPETSRESPMPLEREKFKLTP